MVKTVFGADAYFWSYGCLKIDNIDENTPRAHYQGFCGILSHQSLANVAKLLP